MYYHHQMNTDEIAAALGYSRAKVSRLLNHARDEGIVEIRIVDRQRDNDPLATTLRARYRSLHRLHIVPVQADAPAPERLTRVAQVAAAYLSNEVFEPDQVVGLAGGDTLGFTATFLPHRLVRGIRFVQLQGTTVAGPTGIGYVDGVMMRFGAAFEGDVLLFPVPMVFADPQARSRVWDEPSVRLARDYQERADVYVFSVGIAHLTWERAVLQAGLDEDADHRALLDHDVVGDLATVFFRSDGSYADLAINARSSGPPLETYRRVKRSVCIVSGADKVPGLHAALAAGYVSDLVVDAHTAALVAEYGR
jgi:DNA-binding transcriptional regulator LsrR (DeoR family)